MGDILKEIFKGVGEKLRIPQVIGVVAIILLIFKIIFSLEFENLFLIFISGSGRFGFLINFFQLATVMLFISSVITFIISMFNTVIYLTIAEINNNKKNKSKRLSDISFTMHRFFIGAKIAVININIWLLIFSSYFYMFDERSFNEYKGCISAYATGTNVFIKFTIIIYMLTMFFSLLKLFERMAFKFLYFKLDDETEKKIYDLRDKYSS